MELVSQAEREGITLAAMFTREMSVGEMELVQDELAGHMNDNYAKIKEFMAGISIPSMEEVLSRGDGLQPEFDLGSLDLLSDDDVEEDTI